MKWFSSLQNSSSLEKGLTEAAREIKSKIGRQKADLGLLFISSEYRPEVVDLWPVIKKELQIQHVIGCLAGGVIGGGKEVEDRPAVSLTVGSMPEVAITPFNMNQEQLPDADLGPKAWRELVKTPVEPNPHFLVLSDPFSLDADALIAGLDFAYPSSVKVGGLASGGSAPKENLLLLDEKIFSKGAVGVSLSGNINVEAVVAQGCRPIGDVMTISASDGNILLSLNNKPPLHYLQDLYDKLDSRDQELLQNSLFLGIVMDPFNKSPKQGDFLVRNIIGLDQGRGIMAIGAYLRPGQTVQFHLRDAATSHDDLRLMLSRSNKPKAPQAGAVLFSCQGRGKRLYGQADHDTAILKSFIGDVPVGGFFCSGEIGPVGGKTYLHGYTSSIAVFSPVKESK